jgi:hypothetical protein
MSIAGIPSLKFIKETRSKPRVYNIICHVQRVEHPDHGKDSRPAFENIAGDFDVADTTRSICGTVRRLKDDFATMPPRERRLRCYSPTLWGRKLFGARQATLLRKRE